MPIHAIVHIADSDLWDEELGEANQDIITRAAVGFRFVLSHIARFASLQCNFGSNAIVCKHVFLRELMWAGPAPLLETLALYFENCATSNTLPPEESQVYARPLFHGINPRLRNLTLWGLPANRETQPQLFQSLRTMELGLYIEELRASFDMFQYMLSFNPDLEVLELNFCGPSKTPAWPSVVEGNVVSLHKVNSLTLAGFDPRELCQLIDLIRTPNLERLSLQFEASNPAPGGPTKYDDVLRHAAGQHPIYREPYFGRLSTLHLESVECSREALSMLLNALDTLRRLELEVTAANVDLVHVLSERKKNNSSCPVLPVLDTLKLFHPSDETVTIPHLQNVLMIRASANCKLQTLLIHHDLVAACPYPLSYYAHTVDYIPYDD